ncbi:MAG: universal stress protein, partial [Actinomycetota bacterium]|nr:universal stress protein [Actinomycetota bacterium]
VMFLLLFLQVNYAVIRIRGEFGDRLEYGYLMPFYPWVPIIGIITNAFLAIWLYKFSPLAWYYALAWIAIGIGIFFAYARTRVDKEEKPRITFEEKRGRRTGRTLLAPVANPDHVPTVVSVAAALARQRDAEVVVLNVIRVPVALPMQEGYRYTGRADPVIEAVNALAERFPDVAINTVIAIGRRISQVINDIAERENVQMIVLGWRGEVQESRVRGSVAQEVLRSASSDVIVVRDHGLPERIDEILVGVSPGLRTRATVETGLALAEGFDADLRLLTVTSPDGEVEETREWFDELKSEVAERMDGRRVTAEVIEAESPVETMDSKADHSALLVVGASRDWALRRRLVGEFADKVANTVDRTLVVVKPHEHRALSLWRQALPVLRRRSSA